MSNYVDQNVQFGSTQHVYEEQTHVIPAGQSKPVYFPHNYFRVIDMTGGELAVRFGQNGNVTKHSGAGLGKSHAMVLDQVQLYNIGATDMTITIAMGIGDISDSRLNVSGEVQVKNVTGGTLKTDDDETQAKLDTLITAVGDAQFTTIGANSFAAIGNSAVQTVLSPASNTNGAILRTLSMSGQTSSSAFFADTSAPSGYADYTKRGIAHIFGGGSFDTKDIYLPAGVGMYFACQNTGTVCRVTYDLL